MGGFNWFKNKHIITGFRWSIVKGEFFAGEDVPLREQSQSRHVRIQAICPYGKDCQVGIALVTIIIGSSDFKLRALTPEINNTNRMIDEVWSIAHLSSIDRVHAIDIIEIQVEKVCSSFWICKEVIHWFHSNGIRLLCNTEYKLIYLCLNLNIFEKNRVKARWMPSVIRIITCIYN